MPNFENAFSSVCELVKDFKENENIYLSAKYNESQARKDYIDKFFIALGWDVNHTVQKNPHKQEVLIEQTLDNQRRPDYTFYLEPNFNEPKFFVEAKKPSHDLLNSDYYFQAISYARFANTPVTVLTDFQEFHILDSRYKPNINTVLKDQNHLVFKYTDYTDREKFAQLYYLFSRDDVANNSIKDYADKLTASDKKRKKSGYLKSELLSIDEEFLLYLDNIRVRLAKAFKKSDASLSSEELTEATQRTIDRLVFIRFLEDKNIEPEDFVSKLGTSGKAWNDFITVCRKLDAKYNGIVFKEHFIDNQNFGGPELSEFKNVCYEFSRKNSQSFNYNLIPIHILGSIYERFLGKVVNATAQRVKVEEKPEVRKAGGVYYTPKYIVDYIVDNTVGKILRNENSSTLSSPNPRSGSLLNVLIGDPEDGNSSNSELLTLNSKLSKSPKEISKLRFADIACGSGSFLIGVFETLLDYHNNYYWHNQEEAKKDGCIFKDGVPFLSIKQKQNILLNNIYGVDIDPQAVEVTQLSLALKMLEDESLATANQMQVLFHEQILPNLSKNIICGNSLIGTDIIYEESSAGLFERKRRITIEEERKLNPMDFEKRFPQVFSKSNTTTLSSPHVLGGDLKNTNPEYSGGFDAVVGNPPYGAELFSESYLNKVYKYSSKMKEVNSFVYFVERSCSILKSNGLLGYIIPDTLLLKTQYEYFREFLFKNVSIFEIVETGTVFEQAKATPNILLFFQNIISSLESIIIRRQINPNQKISKILEDFYNKKWLAEGILTYAEWKNSYSLQLGRFIDNLRKSIILKMLKDDSNIKIKSLEGIYIDRGIEGGKNGLSNIKTEKSKVILIPDNIYRYNKSIIPKLYSETSKDSFNYNRILIIRIRNTRIDRRIIATIEDKGSATLKTLQQIYFKKSSNIDLKYILGILNSNCINFLCKHFLVDDLNKDYLSNLMIPNIFSNNKQSHDRIVSLVNEMLEAKKQLQTIKTDRDKTYYENRCADLDHAIDSEVYKLYALTEEEIKIVEGKGIIGITGSPPKTSGDDKMGEEEIKIVEGK